jgi:hypothetical protein
VREFPAVSSASRSKKWNRRKGREQRFDLKLVRSGRGVLRLGVERQGIGTGERQEEGRRFFED